jgi:hypothetical protein
MKGTETTPTMLPPAFIKEVRDRAKFSHMVVFSDHASQRQGSRVISTREILTVLRKGRIEEGPEWDAKHGTFAGTIRHYVAGRDLTVAVALLNGRLMVRVITAYPSGSKK